MDLKGKEKFYYTLMICFGMEFIMAFYNSFFHTDAFLDEAFLLACAEFVPAFLFGVLCEWFLVSKIAKKVASSLHQKHFKDRDIIRINEFMIAIGMMFVISIYGAILHREDTNHILMLIGEDFLKNAIVGIPIFMLLISPLSRYILHEYTRRSKER